MSDGRDYPSRPLLAASLAVIRGDKALLAARARPPWQGLYSLPGGVVELGERLEEAALREAREEVGVVAEIVGPAGTTELIERDEAGRVRRHIVICAFAGRWLGGEARISDEAAAVIWAGERELAALAVTPGLRDVVETARRVVAAS